MIRVLVVSAKGIHVRVDRSRTGHDITLGGAEIEAEIFSGGEGQAVGVVLRGHLATGRRSGNIAGERQGLADPLGQCVAEANRVGEIGVVGQVIEVELRVAEADVSVKLA